MENIREMGKLRRDKAVSMAMKRKEEYLGARVPKELRDKVIERAKNQGIPVSILIRNMLEEAFKGDMLDRRKLVSSEGKELAAEGFGAVIGWESIQLNKTVECSSCGVALQKGTIADIGLGSLQPIVVCRACKESI